MPRSYLATMSLTRVAVGACCTLMLGLHSPSARADSPDSSVRRELAGHVFFPSLIVNNPFLSTYVDLSTAAGYAWISGPDFDAGGNLLGSQSLRAEAMGLGLKFQLSLTELVAIRLQAAGGLDGGSDARSALVVGMVEPLSVGPGVTVGR